MDVDTDLEQLMSNIGQYYFIIMNSGVKFVSECSYRNEIDVLGCSYLVLDI
jgi:hypothetical protein